MNTRLVIPLLCAGALALACSTRTHSEQPARGPALAAIASQGAASHAHGRRAATPRLASTFGVHVDSSQVHFALDVANIGDKHVELAFPSGRAYDFMVVDSLGREVWHWAKGRIFTQTMRTKLLGKGDDMRITESWDRPKLHGRYVAVAILNSSNYPVVERVEFTLQ